MKPWTPKRPEGKWRNFLTAEEVTVVADADFLDLGDLDGPTERNLDALLAELALLARK